MRPAKLVNRVKVKVSAALSITSIEFIGEIAFGSPMAAAWIFEGILLWRAVLAVEKVCARIRDGRTRAGWGRPWCIRN